MGKPIPRQLIDHPLELVDSLFQQATEAQKQDGSDFGVLAHFEQGLREIGMTQVCLGLMTPTHSGIVFPCA